MFKIWSIFLTHFLIGSINDRISLSPISRYFSQTYGTGYFVVSLMTNQTTLLLGLLVNTSSSCMQKELLVLFWKRKLEGKSILVVYLFKQSTSLCHFTFIYFIFELGCCVLWSCYWSFLLGEKQVALSICLVYHYREQAIELTAWA